MALAAKFHVEQSGSGYRWVLKSQGRTLATGPVFARRAMAEKSIDSFRMAAIAAPVDDQTPTRGKAAAPVKAARTTGRAVGKAVGKTAAVVEKVEKTAKRAVKKAAKAVDTATPAPKKTAGRKRAAKR